MEARKGTIVTIEPAGALPVKYGERGIRVSPDIERYQQDGIWYYADGRRDEERSPRQKVEKILPK